MARQTLPSVLRSSTVSEKALLRDTCQWYMRQYEAERKIAEECSQKQREWESRCAFLQSQYNDLQHKFETLEKEVDRLLAVIASMRKPPKRKPLPPKRVFTTISKV
jgi:chromosome segregation ATPase